MLLQKGDAHIFIAQAYKHAKAIGGTGEAIDLVTAALPDGAAINQTGVVAEGNSAKQSAAVQTFIAAIGRSALETSHAGGAAGVVYVTRRS